MEILILFTYLLRMLVNKDIGIKNTSGIRSYTKKFENMGQTVIAAEEWGPCDNASHRNAGC